VITVLSLFLLEIRLGRSPRFRCARWIACRVADFGPATVLVLAAVFLLNFRPFAMALEHYRSVVPTNTAATPDLIWPIMALGYLHSLLYLHPSE